ncbi:1-aminocyclopropane-1-carboxylate deaminase/D-cysteine desulfhydrase [Microbispora amethystogenes]|uniref:1-aminocyclopropane-1-carboxylate deaminase n=1 Tax=Microbispora amethystogenes TaxID=1427754 RepID=A0ABQ4FKP2_9ACTN|nr:pyridoxal-phosphate dependent enzyme [Microbispora amethystogenes]GIH35328.1 1-aminocyclopropane-1-carboxylate deaminase [Microbispora amethystogenes]
MENAGSLFRPPSPVEELIDPRLAARGVRLLLKRDDLLDPEIPGNKWRKLKYNIEAARRSDHATILTFGGAYSNHIRATAAAGAIFGLRTIGVIRGEEHLPLNPTLAYAAGRGMTLTYLDRPTYRRKTESEVIEALHRRFGDFSLIPEGGSNGLAVRGCAEMPDEITQNFDLVCCPCGTGGTLAGIAAGLRGDQEVLGFSVLKGANWLDDEIRRLQEDAYATPQGRWRVNLDYHFGGYAKTTPELLSFIADFEKRHGLRLDRLYTGKMMYGIFDLTEKNRFSPGTTVVAVITGPI